MTQRRTPPAVALVVLLVALAVGIAVTTPWSPLPEVTEVTPPGPDLDFTAAQQAREDAFHAALRPASYAGLLVGLAVAALLGLSSAGGRLVATVARPVGGGWLATVALGSVAVTGAGWLARLPFAARAEAVLRDYGLSTQDWAGWAGDQLRGLALSAGVLALALLVVFGLVRAFPRTWWAPVGLAGAALVVLASFVYPLVVEPVFNRFTPLAAGPLRTDLLALASADGVAVDEVLVADAARRTNAVNAYVSGFGQTRRIVVYDTLLTRGTPAEVRLIVAHELGHTKERDVLSGTLLGALGVAAAAPAGFLLLSWTPLLRRAGVGSAGDPRCLPLVALLVAGATLLTLPVQSLVSRRIEARADVHSLDLTRDPATFATSFSRLSAANLTDLDPPPLVRAVFQTHPSPPQRLAAARAWARANGVDVPPPLAR